VLKFNKYNKIIGYSSLYFLLGTIFFVISGGKPFLTLNKYGFSRILDTFIKSENLSSIEYYLNIADQKFFYFYCGMFFVGLAILCTIKLQSILNGKLKVFKFNYKNLIFNFNHKKNINLYIALAAALGLFLELAIIRIHSSYFQLFAYFKNISLLSCFLGLGIGYSLSKKKLIALGWVFPLLTIEILMLFLLKNTPLTAYMQNPISEQWAMGQSIARGVIHLSSIYLFIILVFVFNALCFIPLGQLVTKLMDFTNPLIAYGYNLFGSLIGVLIFTILSFLWTPPSIWLAIGFLTLLIFLNNFKIPSSLTIISFFIMLAVLISTERSKVDEKDYYSPYQNISVLYSNDQIPVTVRSSHIWFQTPINLSDKYFQKKNMFWSDFYNFPFEIILNKPKDIMIVGSGTGNDVAAALRNNINEIDAVEIDPVIAELGVKFHPEEPYDSKNVNLIINDARNAIKYADKKYDLILYSVLDSHSNLSGKGGIRLDSFVYTLESFKEARTKLAENGYLVLSFAISTEELGIKISSMLKQAFDNKIEPLVFGPHEKKVKDFVDGIYIFVVSEDYSKFNFSNLNFYQTNIFNDSSKSELVDISTDDWPFFYMVNRVYPLSYLSVILVIFGISIILIKKTNNLNYKNFSPTCFFLGAGFMLIETKGITEAAKIFGGTWIVISVIILLILIMAYFANLLIYKKFEIKKIYIYLLLLVSIILSFYSSELKVENYSLNLARILIPIFLTIPVFFSGLAFSSELKELNSSSVALSSNILGALFGGLLEYNSMYFGFKFLYLFAIIIYFLAFVFSKKKLALS